MSVDENVAARKLADECLSLVLEWTAESKVDPELKFACFAILHRCIGELANIPQQPTVVEVPAKPKMMSDAGCRALEERRMPWGKHEGDLIGDVPIDYLEYIVDQPDFKDELKAYLQNASVHA